MTVVFDPRSWRSYRADLKRVIGWNMAELMALPWDEFCAEWLEAKSINMRESRRG